MGRRILIIHCEYKQKGGESSVVQEEIKLLQDDGNAVSLLQFNNEGGTFFKLLQLPFNVFAYHQTIKKIKAFRPHVVHIHNLHFAGTASVIYAAKSQQIPVVMTLHNFRLLCPSATLYFKGNIFTDSLAQNFCWSAIRKGVYQHSKFLTGWLAVSMWMHQKLRTLQLVDKYILLSPHALELFQHSKLLLQKNRLTVKPNFVSQPDLVLTTRGDHFLFAGRLTEEKGLTVLLQTFSANGYPLNIAGDGPERQKVIDYSNRFNNIKYLGALKKKKLIAELLSCSALVFPSCWYEGMPLIIIEAFACGTPVIATNLGAMSTMIQHKFNGLHFNLNDANEFDHQLKYWRELPLVEKRHYTQNAIESYDRFYTPEKNLAQLTAVYDSVTKHLFNLSQPGNIYLN